jgi:hypothetical protein
VGTIALVSTFDITCPVPIIPGSKGVQAESLKVFLYSNTWLELLSVVKETVLVEPTRVIAVMVTQLSASVPKLLTGPMMVPQPVTLALLEIMSPLAKV